MDSEPKLRPAGPDDLACIAAFQARMAEETEAKHLDPATVRAGVAAVLADPRHGFYLLAECGGEVVASLLVTFEWSDWRNGRFFWIQSVYVLPSHRRQGIYRALHADVRRRAQAAGDVVGLRLYVERENAHARATYDAVGMEETPYRLYEEPL